MMTTAVTEITSYTLQIICFHVFHRCYAKLHSADYFHIFHKHNDNIQCFEKHCSTPGIEQLYECIGSHLVIGARLQLTV